MDDEKIDGKRWIKGMWKVLVAGAMSIFFFHFSVNLAEIWWTQIVLFLVGAGWFYVFYRRLKLYYAGQEVDY